MDIHELYEKIRAVLPDAQFQTDNDGQIIIYTNKIIITSVDNASIDAGDSLIVDFDPTDIQESYK